MAMYRKFKTWIEKVKLGYMFLHVCVRLNNYFNRKTESVGLCR